MQIFNLKVQNLRQINITYTCNQSFVWENLVRVK